MCSPFTALQTSKQNLMSSQARKSTIRVTVNKYRDFISYVTQMTNYLCTAVNDRIQQCQIWECRSPGYLPAFSTYRSEHAKPWARRGWAEAAFCRKTNAVSFPLSISPVCGKASNCNLSR